MAKFTLKGVAKLTITAVVEADTEEEALEIAENDIGLQCSPLAFDTYYGLPHSVGELDNDDDIEWEVLNESSN